MEYDPAGHVLMNRILVLPTGESYGVYQNMQEEVWWTQLSGCCDSTRFAFNFYDLHAALQKILQSFKAGMGNLAGLALTYSFEVLRLQRVSPQFDKLVYKGNCCRY